jgi:3-deoxy-D-manno-octulosonate 8-phosphate phosphatase (KDO 8-P phosphatase)
MSRASNIKVILFDVDGVLTDGTIWLFPAPAGAQQANQARMDVASQSAGFAISSATFVEAKGFNAHDGTGISLARIGGLKTGVVTKRISETVALRARDLKIDFVYQGQADKVQTMEKVMAEAGVAADEIAYVGDDIVDLAAMKRCGLAIAVANARPEIIRIAHFVTPSKGGEGAARDAIEYVLREQGKLDRVIEEYLATRPAAQAAGEHSLT